MHSTIHAVCWQQKGQNRAKSHVTDIKKKKKNFFFFFFLVSRYLGRDTIHVSPAQVSRCIDASMHRYDPSREYVPGHRCSGKFLPAVTFFPPPVTLPSVLSAVCIAHN